MRAMINFLIPARWPADRREPRRVLVDDGGPLGEGVLQAQRRHQGRRPKLLGRFGVDYMMLGTADHFSPVDVWISNSKVEFGSAQGVLPQHSSLCLRFVGRHWFHAAMLACLNRDPIESAPPLGRTSLEHHVPVAAVRRAPDRGCFDFDGLAGQPGSGRHRPA